MEIGRPFNINNNHVYFIEDSFYSDNHNVSNENIKRLKKLESSLETFLLLEKTSIDKEFGMRIGDNRVEINDILKYFESYKPEIQNPKHIFFNDCLEYLRLSNRNKDAIKAGYIEFLRGMED